MNSRLWVIVAIWPLTSWRRISGTPKRHETLTRCWPNAGPALAQHSTVSFFSERRRTKKGHVGVTLACGQPRAGIRPRLVPSGPPHSSPTSSGIRVRICRLQAATESHIPANTTHLYDICTMLDKRRRRWSNIIQMLYKCFVFAGMHGLDSGWSRIWCKWGMDCPFFSWHSEITKRQLSVAAAFFDFLNSSSLYFHKTYNSYCCLILSLSLMHRLLWSDFTKIV